MFWSSEIGKYVAYIRVDNTVPDPHVDFPCANPWLVPGRRIGRCLIAAEQLHDWSLAGCTSQYGYPVTDTTACPTGPHHNCAPHGPAYHAIRCTRTNATVDDGGCGRKYGTCGSVHATCNGSGFCVVPRGSQPGPLCTTPRAGPASSRNGTTTVLSFDEQDPSCMDIYTNTATPYEESGVVLFFPSAFQHMDLAGDPTPHNDGLVDIRFGAVRSVLDNICKLMTHHLKLHSAWVAASCEALMHDPF